MRVLLAFLLIISIPLAGCASAEKIARRAAEGGLTGSTGGPLGLAAGAALGVGVGVYEILSGGREQESLSAPRQNKKGTAEVLREKTKKEEMSEEQKRRDNQ